MANFDFIAPVYDLLAKIVYGKAIRNAQTCYLDQIPNGVRVLILGGGTGWILEEISNPSLRIDYVDHSKVMLQKAQKRPVTFAELRFIHGTEQTVAEQKYDVVITPFVLDVCTDPELPQMVSTIAQLINATGRWLCIDFDVHDRSPKARVLVVAMCLFFRIVSGLKLTHILPYFEAVEQAGFAKTKTQYFYGRFIKAAWFTKAPIPTINDS